MIKTFRVYEVMILDALDPIQWRIVAESDDQKERVVFRVPSGRAPGIGSQIQLEITGENLD